MEAIASKSAELSKVMMKMGEAAYQAEADADGNAGEAGDDESVVDAEFEEVDADSDDGKKKSK
jgi:molecular chaperone DnaK